MKLEIRTAVLTGAAASTLLALVVALSSAACGGSTSSSSAALDGGTDAVVPDAATTDAASSDAAADVDHGEASTVYPAFKPSEPQLVLADGGAVMAHPVFRTLYFPGATNTAALNGVLASWFSSPTWTEQVGEYGVGVPTIMPVTFSDAAPMQIDDTEIQTWLAGKLDGTHPEMGPVDAATLATTIYSLVYPNATTVTWNGETVGRDTSGYHSSMMVGANAVSYIVTTDIADIDVLTYAVSWNVLGAVTNPFIHSRPAYAAFDQAHFAWSPSYADVPQACGQAFVQIAGHRMQQAWSNAAIRAYHDPCVPTPAGSVFYQSVPVMDDDVTYAAGMKTKGILVPLHTSRTVDVLMLSDGPTEYPWSVSVVGYPFNAGVALAKFELDRTSGTNGEKLRLTITAERPGLVAFRVTSTLGTTRTDWYGLVGQQ